MVNKSILKPQRGPIKHFAADDPKVCVYEIYSRPKQTVYYVRGGQAKHVDRITLSGYQGLPSGLYLNRKGYGPGKKGFFLLAGMKQHLSPTKRLELTISSTGERRIKKGAS